MKRIIIVTGHCDTKEKEKIVIKLLKEIRKRFDCKILFSSHIFPNNEIAELSDYVVYLKENIIENVDWYNRTSLDFNARIRFKDYSDKENTLIELIKTKPLHGYAHHHIMTSALRVIEHSYDVIHFINYDAHYGALDNIPEFEQYIKAGYDGVFYDFRNGDSRMVNTECYTINNKIKEHIEKYKTIDDYYKFNHIMCEYVYTELVKNFQIKRVGPFKGNPDGEIGSIQFRNSKDGLLKPLFPEHPDFIVFPYIDLYSNDKLMLFIPRRSDVCVTFQFFEYKTNKLLANNKIENQKEGILVTLELPEKLIKSYCKILDKDGGVIFNFDLGNVINWGFFTRNNRVAQKVVI